MKTVRSRGLCGCGEHVWTFHPVHAPYGQKRVLDKKGMYWHLSCFIKHGLLTPLERARAEAYLRPPSANRVHYYAPKAQ